MAKISKVKKFTIITDTREQKPFLFNKNKDCDGSIVKTVQHGDYSIAGLENYIFLERKHSIGEWSKNCTEKRFKNLLEKAADYKYRYIICSFPYFDILQFPASLKVSPHVKARIRITSEFIQSFTTSIPVKWNIPIVFFDFPEQAQKFTYQYLKWIARHEGLI